MEKKKNLKFRFPSGGDYISDFQMHAAHEARKIATQEMPVLWVKLHADLNCNRSLPDELGQVLRQRLQEEAYAHILTIHYMKANLDIWKSVKIPQIKLNPNVANMFSKIVFGWTIRPGKAAQLVRRVYSIFLRQLLEYRKKYQEDISETIQQAKAGDKESIYRLLKWDKTWIRFDFVHNRIAQWGYFWTNDGFLERMGTAISKKPAVKKYRGKSTSLDGLWKAIRFLLLNGRDLSENNLDDLLKAIAFLANLYDLNLPKNNKLLKEIHDRIYTDYKGKRTIQEEKLLLDFSYFKKYLKRQNII